MPIDLSGTLRQAIDKLQAEKARIERQIIALRQALNAGMPSVDGREVRANPAGRARKGMSLKARKAASARMKAYWAKRRAARSKSGRKKAA